MKRMLSFMLVLAMLSLIVTAPALAEAPEIYSADVEVQAAPAELTGEDTGLVTEGADVVAPQTWDEPAVAEPVEESAPSPYARVQSESATLYIDPEGTQPLGAIASGSVVLTLGQEGLMKVALYCERGLHVCFVDPACLAPLSGAEHAAYMDAVASGAPVMPYADDLNLPLALVACAYMDAEPAEAVEGEAGVMAPDAEGEAVAPELAPAVEEAAAVDTGIAAIRMAEESITIGVKDTYGPLTVIAEPAGVPVPVAAWRSDNTKYVKVDTLTGVIVGAKKGAAYVFATLANGMETACLVNVEKAPRKILIDPKTLTLGSGGMTAQLTWSLPRGGVTHSITFASNNPSVVTVDQNGLVTSVNPGSAVVAVKTHNGKTSKCKIKVVPAPATVVFPSASLSLATGQTLPINAAALSVDGKAAESSFTYSIDVTSPDAGCVALDPANGTVTGVRKGQAIITATAYNGVAASWPVVVAPGPSAIKLSEDAINLGVKEVFTGLQVELTPMPGEAECASGITWTVSNPKLIRVDEATGSILGLKKGSCTLTATTVNGLSTSCSVTVYRAPSRITLSPASGTLEIGQTGQYKVGFSRKAGGSVTFDTSDPSIATIDDDGVVTAVSMGTVAIMATSFNGKKALAKLVVTQPSVYLPTEDNYNVESSTDTYDENMSNAQKLEYVIYMAQTQKGKPYKYGGGYSKEANPSGFDCSGLVYWSFLHIGVKVEASAYRQGYDQTQQQILNAAELRRGDIVCFNTNENDSDLSDHTGIYLGNGQFIHASSSAKKVIVSTLASGYYSRTFSWGRRVLP